MKPHEETWEDVPGVEVEVRDIVSVGEATAIRDVPARVASLIAAAPELARALLAVLEREKGSDLRFTLGSGILDDIRAALTKAGVL